MCLHECPEKGIKKNNKAYIQIQKFLSLKTFILYVSRYEQAIKREFTL